MKKNTKSLKQALLILFASATILNSCTSLSKEDKKMLSYIHDNKITYEQLATLDGNDEQPNTNCTSCDTLSYCGVSQVDLETYVNEYRDKIWRASSGISATASLASLSSSYTSFQCDSRYMDMPIDQLENYLCAIKNSRDCAGVNTIRFFYIRYHKTYNTPTSTGLPANAYQNKHSLALVPVEKDNTGATVKEIFSKEGSENSFVWLPGGTDCQKEKYVFNHNPICPPPYNTMSPFLQALDH